MSAATMSRSAYGLSTPTSHWEAQAACTQAMTPDAWNIAAKNDPAGQRTNAKAITICRTRCPVAEQCLRQALTDDDRGVIRGGVPLERAPRTAVCSCGTRYVRVHARVIRCPSCSTRTKTLSKIHKTPSPPTPGKTKAARNAAAMAAGRNIAQWGGTYQAWARAHGVHVSHVASAAWLVRHRPDLAARVDAGELTVRAARNIGHHDAAATANRPEPTLGGILAERFAPELKIAADIAERRRILIGSAPSITTPGR